MSKIARLFTVDVEVYDEARRRGINLSEAAELGLRSVLDMEEVKEKARIYSSAMKELLEEITDEDMRKCTDAIRRDPQFAKGWVRIFERNYNIEVTQKEVKEVFGKKE